MAKKKAASKKLPLWVWLLTGLALAGLVTFLILLSKLTPPQYTAAQQQATESETVHKKETHFDFYNSLKNIEIPAQFDVNKAKKQKKIADDVTYLLQVASFKSLSDAKQVRAEIILLGLDARIEQANAASGSTWHRIIVGPFATRSKLQRARNILISNRYEALLLKRKNKKKH